MSTGKYDGEEAGQLSSVQSLQLEWRERGEREARATQSERV